MKVPAGFICGHEFVGEIVETGAQVSKVQKGDQVVVPFTASCQECFYCLRGQSSRCTKCILFGMVRPVGVDGGQAEYVRVPLAESSLVKTPKGKSLVNEKFPRLKSRVHSDLTDEIQGFQRRCSF